MTIEISDEDVIKSLAAYRRSESWSPHWVSCVGMRAALESFVARHPELAPQTALHEPVSDAELEAMMRAIHYGPSGASWADNVRAAGNGLLAGRAASKPEPVVVTEEMVDKCLADWESALGERKAGPIVPFCLNWLADHLNGKHEKPVDPRVAVFTKAMVERGYDLGSVEDFEFILAKLDNAKT